MFATKILGVPFLRSMPNTDHNTPTSEWSPTSRALRYTFVGCRDGWTCWWESEIHSDLSPRPWCFALHKILLQSGIDSVMQVSATLVIGALDHWSIRWLQADTGHPSSGKSLWQGAWTRTRGFRLENTTLAKTRQSFHKTHPARCDSTKLQIHLCFRFKNPRLVCYPKDQSKEVEAGPWLKQKVPQSSFHWKNFFVSMSSTSNRNCSDSTLRRLFVLSKRHCCTEMMRSLGAIICDA